MAWIAQPFASVVDPWALIDGRANAPGGPAQYPTILNGYPTATPPNARIRWPSTGTQPPWLVSGVDYAVGIDRNLYPTNANLKDPNTILSTISGVTGNNTNHTVSITGNNVTLDGYDFSLNNGWGVSTSASGTTLSNCNWLVNGAGQNPCNGGSSASNFTVTKCIIDGNGISVSNGGNALINHDGSGLLTVQYCWLKNAASDGISYGGSGLVNTTADFRFNLFDQLGQLGGAHPDWNQFGGGIWTSIVINFNLGYSHNPVVPQPPQGFDVGDANAGSTTTSGEGAYNTMIAVGASNSVSYFIAPENPGGTSANNIRIHDNYVDPTRVTNFTKNTVLATYSNNHNLLNGNVFTTVP